MKDAIFGAKDKAKNDADAQAKEAPAKVQEAEAKVGEEGTKANAEAAKTEKVADQQKTKAEQQQTKEAAAADTKAKAAGKDTEKRANELPEMAKSAEPLLEPAAVAVGDSAATAAGEKVSKGAAAAGGPEAAAQTAGVADKADLTKGQLNCPTIDVASLADGIPAKALQAAAGVVSSLTGIPADKIVKFGEKVGAGIKNLATEIGGHIKKAGEGIKKIVGPHIDEAKKQLHAAGEAISKGLDNAKKAVGEEFDKRKKQVVEGATKIVNAGKAELTKRAEDLKKNAGAAVEKIKSMVAKFWKMLGPLQPVIMALGAPFMLAAGAVMKYGPKLIEAAGKAKDKFIADLKKKGDAALKNLAEARKLVGKWKDDRKKDLAKLWEDAKGKIPASWKKGASDIAGAAKKKVLEWKKAAVDIGKKKAGEVCAAVGPEAEACATQYLPNLGEGNKSSIKLVANAEMIVPLHEVGVPANLKVGKGATVEVVRVGSGAVGKNGAAPNNEGKSFQVIITGDAAVYINEGVGEANDAKVNVDVPGLGPKVKGLSWDKLSGKGATGPGAPSLGKNETSKKADLDVGIRGQTVLTYGFTAGKTNCQGLGGVVALLGAMGCAASLPTSWGIVGQAIVDEVFADNLVSKRFTVAAGVQVSGEVANGVIGKLGGKAGAEVSTTAGVDVSVDEKTGARTEKPVLEIGGKLYGEGAAELDNGIISGVSLGASASAGVTLGLAYDRQRDTIDVNTVQGNVELGLSRAGFNPANFARLLGADGVAKSIEGIAGLKGDSGSIKVAGNITISNVNQLTNALDDLFNDPNKVSVDSTLKTARENFAKLPKTIGYTVTVSNASRLFGVSAEGEVRGEGMTAGGKAGVTLDSTEERVIASGKREI